MTQHLPQRSLLLFSIALIGILFSGCSKNINLTRMAPAEIHVPNHLQKILLVDRSAPANETLAVLEGIITGEAPFEVRNAIEATIAGMQQDLYHSPRFEVIRARERLRGGTFGQTFPQPLTWPQIEALCKEYNADGVLALEKFSSDFIITDKKKMIKKTVGTGKEARQVEVEGIYLEGMASVGAGFRLYDPQNKNIFDQMDYNKTNLWSAEAETRTQAAALLIDKVKATQFVGRMAGASYARRIAPMPMAISRTLYHKPRNNPWLSRGSRQAEVGQWEEAVQSWQQGLANFESDKESGRICHNIALAYEVLGQLEEAKYWAGKAFTDYGFKQGRVYARQLEQRLWEEERLRQQLEKGQ